MGRSKPPEPPSAGVELRPRTDQLPGTGPILIAFSGGPDSVCLAALVAAERPSRPVECIHIDHQLDPDSHTRALRAKQIAGQLGLDCRIERVRTVARDGPEASARRARYRALAKRLPAGGVLLTAHHANDQTETILLRLLRGAGPDGLAGIPFQRPFARGWIVRPLLDQTRDDLLAWLSAQGLDWIDDPANDDRRFDRNALRMDILPVLVRRWPGVERAIRRSGMLCRGASEALGELAVADLERCRESTRRLELAPLLELSAFRRASVIRRWCLDVGLPPPPGGRLDELLSQIDCAAGDRCPEMRWDQHALRVWNGRLWLLPRDPASSGWAIRWTGEQPLDLPEPVGRLFLESALPVRLPGLEVRPGTDGEGLRLAARGHRQSVRELMRMAGVPPWQRALWPRLWRDGRLLAVGTRWLTPDFAAELERRACRLVWESSLDNPELN